MKRAHVFLRISLAPAMLAAILLMSANASAQVDLDDTTVKPGEHPLEPAMRIAKSGLAHIDQSIQDYTCTMVKRERINGELTEREYIYTKIRHQPYSVSMHFLGPKEKKGDEAVFVAGQDRGKVHARTMQGARKLIGWVSLDPNSLILMNGQRYPITMTGVRTLTERLIEVGERDKKFAECEVKFFKGAKINGRKCTCIQVTHPIPRRQFEFNIARVFIDDELMVPVRYESYSWPKKKNGDPVLEEEYTYLNIKVNQGLTNADFDYKNPANLQPANKK